MGKLAVWNEWLSRNMYVGTLTALLLGFCFSLEKSPVLTAVSIGLFAYMTFVTSIGTSLREFVRVLKKPLIPLWVLALIHIAAPALAWVFGELFFHDNYLIRLGFLLSGSIPIGVTSIIWATVAGGNLALVIVVVTLDTLIAPVLLPAFFALAAGQTISVNFVTMLQQLLLMITLPSLAGMTINDLSGGSLVPFARSIGGFTSKLAVFVVLFMNAAIVGPILRSDLGLFRYVPAVLVFVLCGYGLGLLGALVLGKKHRDKLVSVVFSVGIRNITFGAVIALAYFPPEVALPVTLSMLFQQPVSALIARYMQNIKLDETAR